MKRENTFEEKLLKLQQLVAKLEHGNLNLQQSIDLFKEGTQLVKECQAYLKKTDLEIKKVIDETGATVDIEETE